MPGSSARIRTSFALSPDRGNRVRVTRISPNHRMQAAYRLRAPPSACNAIHPVTTKKNGRRAFALPAVVLLTHYCCVGSPCGAPGAPSFSSAFADKRTRPFSSVWMTLTFTCWPSFR